MKRNLLLLPYLLLTGFFLPISYCSRSLCSQCIIDIKSGDERKAIEALEKIENDRKKLISALSEILEENKKLEKPNLVAVKYALLALGKIKAIEAIDNIISCIDLPVFEEPDQDEMWIPAQQMYPAVAALHDIGPSVINPLLNGVAKGGLSRNGVKNVGFLIVWLFNDEGKVIVERYASKLSSEDERLRVLSADIMKYYK